MKRILLLTALLFSFDLSFSQNIPNYDELKLENASDYAAADTVAHLAADFLLSNPVDQLKQDRSKSAQFLIKWMGGTPDYTFNLDFTTKNLDDDVDLLTLYMAAMTKFCLENRSSTNDQNQIKVNSWKILLTYCGNSNNNVKMTKKLKKLSDANQKGELEKSL